MLARLIDDINRALDNRAYFAALSLALTLPDICGKAKYPTERNNKKRYIDWFDEYVGQYEQCPCDDCKQANMPYLNGEIVYSLRNSMLHQGTPNIDNRDIKNAAQYLDEFVLHIEPKNEFNVHVDSAGIITSYEGNQIAEVKRRYRINVRRFCFVLSSASIAYYQQHIEQFNFFNFSIIDEDV